MSFSDLSLSIICCCHWQFLYFSRTSGPISTNHSAVYSWMKGDLSLFQQTVASWFDINFNTTCPPSRWILKNYTCLKLIWICLNPIGKNYKQKKFTFTIKKWPAISLDFFQMVQTIPNLCRSTLYSELWQLDLFVMLWAIQSNSFSYSFIVIIHNQNILMMGE